MLPEHLIKKHDQPETFYDAPRIYSRTCVGKINARWHEEPDPLGGVLTIGRVTEVAACLANELVP